MRKSISLMIALLTSTAGLSAAQPTPSTTAYSPCAVIACGVVATACLFTIPWLKEAFIASRTKARIAEIKSLFLEKGLESLQETLPNGQKVLLRKEDCFNVCYINGYKVDTRAFLEEGKIVYPRYPRYR